MGVPAPVVQLGLEGAELVFEESLVVTGTRLGVGKGWIVGRGVKVGKGVWETELSEGGVYVVFPRTVLVEGEGKEMGETVGKGASVDFAK